MKNRTAILFRVMSFVVASILLSGTLHAAGVTFGGVDYAVTSFEFGEVISGIDYDPASGHLFMVDDRDDFSKIDIVYQTDIQGNVISSFEVPGAPYHYLRGLCVSGNTLTLVTNRAILQMDTDGNNFQKYPMNDSAFNDFSGIAHDPASNNYYISRGGKGIYVTDGNFNELRLIDTPALGYNQPAGVDFDPSSGTLLVMDDSTDNLFELTTGGSVSGEPVWLLGADFPSRISRLTSVAVDPGTGTYYLTGRLYTDSWKVVVMTPQIANVNGMDYSASFFEFGEVISGIDYDPASGHLFMVDDRDDFSKIDIVYQTDIQGNVISSFEVPGAPYHYLRGLCVSGNTLTLVTNRAILQMDTDGNNFQKYPMNDSAFNDFSGIAHDPASNNYYISRGGKGIYVTDGNFNELRLIDTPALGYNQPAGVDFDPSSGTLLVMDDSTDNLFELTTGGSVSGEPVWLLGADFPSRISRLTSVAVDPGTGTYYLTGRLYTDSWKVVVMRPTPRFAEGEPVTPPGTVADDDSAALLNLPFGSLTGPTSWTITAEDSPLGEVPVGITPVSVPVHFDADDSEIVYAGGGSIFIPVDSKLCEGTYQVPQGYALLFECREYWPSMLGGGCSSYVNAYRQSEGFVTGAAGACVAVFKDIDHFSTYFAAVFNAPGDLDGDGDVDRDDLNIILAARNQPADDETYGEGNDPRDLDGDGMITALDARKLVLLCTCPRCVCPPS